MNRNKEYILPDHQMEGKRTRDREHSVFSLDERYRNLGAGKTYYIRTYGCAANERDSQNFAGILEEMGFTASHEYLNSDVLIFNTCAVRKSSEDHVLGELGHLKYLKEEKPSRIFVLAGCMSQEESVVRRIISKYPMVDVVIGTHNIASLPSMLERAMKQGRRTVEVKSSQGSVVEGMPLLRPQIFKGSVSIMIGCDKFCSYCIVPYTRGTQRSRLPENVIREVEEFKKQGGREVMLLGQNVNAYGKDLGEKEGFARLLARTAETGIERIRFDSAHPRDFTEEAVHVMASYPNIMPALHLAVQSGSNEILKRMNRGYTIAQYLDLIDKIRHEIPDILLTTDLIVGFPGETDAQFQQTLDLVDEVQFYNAYAFIYSPREGTPAADMEDAVPMEVKKERLQILLKHLSSYSRRYNEPMLGKTVTVLCEGASRRKTDILCGYTPHGRMVNFPGKKAKAGDMVEVKITEAKSFSLDGEEVQVLPREKE